LETILQTNHLTKVAFHDIIGLPIQVKGDHDNADETFLLVAKETGLALENSW